MLVATLPPYVAHRQAIVDHPGVGALRFNTIMPVGEEKPDVLRSLRDACGTKPLWIDLKGRQLRITQFAYLPFAYVDVSHRLTVDLPARIHFKDGEAEVVRVVGGNRLILADRPPRVVGAGEPVNILDSSLRIHGFLTEDDKEYVRAARDLGIHRYMLSFVEEDSDIRELMDLDPDAQVLAKIESRRGLAFVRDHYDTHRQHVRLMAARDDLYINMGPRKVEMLDALALILREDPEAVVASRVLTSLEEQETVSLADLSDLHLMHRMGFRHVMLSDGLCFRERAFRRAMEVWGAYQDHAGRQVLG
jgi:hypothetical protein